MKLDTPKAPMTKTNLTHRPRRLRTSPALRAMVRETSLSPVDLIYPMFVRHGRNIRQPIASMPGIAQLSVDEAVIEAKKAAELGFAKENDQLEYFKDLYNKHSK